MVVGQRSLNSKDWDPVDQQQSIVLETAWGRADWPVLVALDAGLSKDRSTVDTIEFEGRTLELSLGVRRWFRDGRFRPYVGAGGSFVQAEIEANGFGEVPEDDDSATGFWLGAGLTWRVVSRLDIGLTARYSSAEVTLAGVDGDAGGTTVGVSVGWSWSTN